MDIKALQWELAAFVVDRGLDPLQTPKNLSMALAAEAGTLLALFKWRADDGGPGLGTPAERGAAADALADSVLHAVHLADRLGIDLEEAIRRKLARNAENYPAAGRVPAQVAPAPAPPAPPPAPTFSVPAAPAPAAFAPAASPPAAPAPGSAPPERRVAPDRRAGTDRRVATERRFEPERRSGGDRRAESERRGAAQRASQPMAVDVRMQGPPSRAMRTESPRARNPEPPPPPPAARFEPPPPPPPAPEPEPEADPYANLDPDAARRLVEALSKQVTRARTDDPLARELHDELTTLKRTLYAENPKRAWVAGSLKSIRRILEEATSHSVGAELRAREHLADVDRILDA
jgi:NTP pyrophosphatase (non-canonical NTP hydrolase)